MSCIVFEIQRLDLWTQARGIKTILSGQMGLTNVANISFAMRSALTTVNCSKRKVINSLDIDKQEIYVTLALLLLSYRKLVLERKQK